MGFDLAYDREDRAKAENGIWLSWRGVRFLVASARTTAYARAAERAIRGAPGTENGGDEAALRARIIEAAATTLLLGWDGVTRDGQPEPFTRDGAVEALSEMPDFADWVMAQAQNADHFRVGKAAPSAAGADSGGDESSEGKATASV